MTLVGTLNKVTTDACDAQGAEYGAYHALPPIPAMDRFTFGLWSWKAQPWVTLVWAYLDRDYSRAEVTPAGVRNTTSMDALRAGIIDHRVLQAVHALGTQKAHRWLAGIEERTPLNWWPRVYVETWEQQRAQVPRLNMDVVRAEGLDLLREAGH